MRRIAHGQRVKSSQSMLRQSHGSWVLMQGSELSRASPLPPSYGGRALEAKLPLWGNALNKASAVALPLVTGVLERAYEITKERI